MESQNVSKRKGYEISEKISSPMPQVIHIFMYFLKYSFSIYVLNINKNKYHVFFKASVS